MQFLHVAAGETSSLPLVPRRHGYSYATESNVQLHGHYVRAKMIFSNDKIHHMYV